MSDSLIQLPLIDSGASFAGTCLIQTMMFIGVLDGLAFASETQEIAAPGGLELFPGPALENQRGVGAAKTERVRKRVFDVRFSRDIRNIIEIALRIRRFEIDRRRRNLIAQRQHTDTRFQS